MAWTNFFVEKLPNAKLVVNPEGLPFISMRIDKNEFIAIEMEIDNDSCPFSIYYRHFDELGNILEERRYGKAGTRELARDLALKVANLRLNSKELVLDGE